MKNNILDVRRTSLKLEAALRQLEEADISPKNKNIIKAFVNIGRDEKLSNDRLIKYIRYPLRLAKFLKKDFDKLTEEDCRKYLRKVNSNKDYSIWSKHEIEVMCKQFGSFVVYRNDYRNKTKIEGYPKNVRWIICTLKRKDKPQLQKSQLLTQEEIMKLIDTATNPRDKCLMALLYESGGRISEILTLKLSDVENSQEGMSITIRQSKTQQRTIPFITLSVPYVRMWLENHPDKENLDSPLFLNIGTTNHNEPLMYDSVRMLLNKLRDKAGIKKNLTAHTFRRSRASYLANYMNEFQMNQYFGWVMGSDVAGSYIKLSAKELKNSLASSNGEKIEEENRPKQIICPVCREQNPHYAKLCARCLIPLDEESKHKAEIANKIVRKVGIVDVTKENLKDAIREMIKSGEISLK